MTAWTRYPKGGFGTLSNGAGCAAGRVSMRERLCDRLEMGSGCGEEAGAFLGREVLPATGVVERDIGGTGGGGPGRDAPECYVPLGETTTAPR